MQEDDHPPAGTSQASHADSLSRIDTLRAMLQADPHNLRVRQALGALHFQRGDFADAAVCFEAVHAALPDDPALHSDLALALVFAGELDAALAHYTQIVAAAALPAARADAWRDQGVVLQRLGRLDEALAAYEQAIACEPRHVGALINRASLLEKRMQHEEALASLDAALAIAPDASDALINRAVTLESLGRLEEALGCLEKEMERGSTRPVVWSNAGVLLRKLGQLSASLDCHDRAIAVGQAEALARHEEKLADQDRSLAMAPDDPDLLHAHGLSCEALGRHDEALADYDRMLACAPRRVDAWESRARVRLALAQWRDALADIDAALRLAPDQPDLHAVRNLILSHLDTADAGPAAQPSSASRTVDRMDIALVAGDGPLALGGIPAITWYNRAVVLAEMDRRQEAIADLERALALDPDDGAAQYARGLLRLSSGDFDRGWEQHEARWHIPDAQPLRHTTIPRWDGRESLRGKRILVWFEQGYGDTIQFCRLVPELAARHPGAQVIFEVPRTLVRLCRSLPDCHVIEAGSRFGRADFQIPLMSLPRAFGLTLEDVSPRMPYLHPDKETLLEWRSRLGPASRRMRIGLACSGNPALKHNRRRSIPLSAFAPLQRYGRIYVLQNQLDIEDRRFLASQTGMTFIGQRVGDFCDTAALVAQMDLVISVDTSLAHLAGALAKPVWVVLPRPCCWRWLRERSDSPWYPSMRLFRNEDPTGWTVLAEVDAALADRASRHRARFEQRVADGVDARNVAAAE